MPRHEFSVAIVWAKKNAFLFFFLDFYINILNYFSLKVK